eukprot:COSAG06_NODE_40378_length_402_cov_1.141914_1_plen_126_part_01
MAAGCSVLLNIGFRVYAGAVKRVGGAVFCEGLRTVKWIAPSQPPAEWWLSTSEVSDATSLCLGMVYLMLGEVRSLPSVVEQPWWVDMLGQAMQLTKLNAEAELSSRPTMSFLPIQFGLKVVEIAAR